MAIRLRFWRPRERVEPFEKLTETAPKRCHDVVLARSLRLGLWSNGPLVL